MVIYSGSVLWSCHISPWNQSEVYAAPFAQMLPFVINLLCNLFFIILAERTRYSQLPV